MLTANDIEHLIAVLDITRKQCLDGEFETLSESMSIYDKRHSLCSQLYRKLDAMYDASATYEEAMEHLNHTIK